MIGKPYYTAHQIKNREQRYDSSLGFNSETNLPYIRELTQEDSDIAKFVHIQGFTSTSLDIRVALDFAKTSDRDQEMVLFVICIQNYKDFEGFRMNNRQYTAYPEEKEILLMEGFPVAILGADEHYFDTANS